jgi:outer membrane protein TolC
MRGAFLAAAITVLAACPVVARAQVPLTLQEAVSYALARDPAVASKRATVASDEHAVSVQEANTFPTVNGTLQNVLSKQENYGGIYQIIGFQQPPNFSQNTASVGTNWTLNSGGLQLLQLAADKASLASARKDLQRAEDLIASNVTNAFFNVSSKEGIVALDRADLSYQEALVAAARIKNKEGAAAGVDVLRARVAAAKSESALVGAKADVVNATEQLAHTAGVPLDTPFAVPTTVPAPPIPSASIDTLEATAIANRPDIVQARKALLSAVDTRKGWDRELFPSLNITASMGNQYSPTESVELQNELDAQFLSTNQQRIAIGLPPLPASLRPVVPRGTPGYWQIGLTSTFTLPLLDYGERHTERTSDDAQIAADEAVLANTISQAQLDVREQYRAAQTAQAQLAYAKEEARLGIEAARIAQLQYRNGVIALADVIQAQQTSVQAQTDLVNARVAYVDAVVALRVALGTYDAHGAVADL